MTRGSRTGTGICVKNKYQRRHNKSVIMKIRGTEPGMTLNIAHDHPAK
jgi:hypothetical protein